MGEVLQWPVNLALWLEEWQSLGGDVVGDKVINPAIFPGCEIDIPAERRMVILAGQYNHPAGRKAIRAYVKSIRE